jgi:hypothetical protein
MNAGVFFLLRGFGPTAGAPTVPDEAGTAFSPADVLARHLVLAGYATLAPQSLETAWPVYVGEMPPQHRGTTPANALSVHDTVGVRDGRRADGPTLVRPGAMLRVRSVDYLTGYRKAVQLRDYLDTVEFVEVDFGDVAYVLVNASRRGDVIDLGKQEDAGGRNRLFTINYLLTVNPVS